MHRAAEHGDADSCHLLVKAGAHALLKDGAGKTARDYAKEHGYTKCSGILAKAESKDTKKKNVKRRVVALGKLEHVAHNHHAPPKKRLPKMHARTVHVKEKKKSPPVTPPPGGRYREKGEVIEDLESVLSEVKAQENGHLKVDSLALRMSRAVHARTPDPSNWHERKGSVGSVVSKDRHDRDVWSIGSNEKSPDVWSVATPDRPPPEKTLDELLELPSSVAGDSLPGDDEQSQVAEPPPASHRYDWREPPRTPATPPTDTTSILGLLEPPDEEIWKSDLIPEPPRPNTAGSDSNKKKRKKKRKEKRKEKWDSDLPRPPSAHSRPGSNNPSRPGTSDPSRKRDRSLEPDRVEVLDGSDGLSPEFGGSKFARGALGAVSTGGAAAAESKDEDLGATFGVPSPDADRVELLAGEDGLDPEYEGGKFARGAAAAPAKSKLGAFSSGWDEQPQFSPMKIAPVRSSMIARLVNNRPGGGGDY